MGADLYESYCGSILATTALGASAFYGLGEDMQLRAVFAPMVIAAVGVVLSIIGIYTVRTKEGAGMSQLLKSLGFGTNLSAALIAVDAMGGTWHNYDTTQPKSSEVGVCPSASRFVTCATPPALPSW